MVKKGVVNNQESPNSLSLPFQTPVRQASKRIGSLNNDDGDGNENGKKKNNRFILANNNFDAFFVHFLALTVREYNVKVPYYTC